MRLFRGEGRWGGDGVVRIHLQPRAGSACRQVKEAEAGLAGTAGPRPSDGRRPMRQPHVLTACARGFSLLELTMVILLIGILTAAAALSLGGFVGRGKVRVTQTSLTTIKGALESYRLEHNALPPDLRTLVVNKYLEDKALVDAWNRPFIYVVPGRQNRPFELQSRGEDENDPSDDISVWDIHRPSGT